MNFSICMKMSFKWIIMKTLLFWLLLLLLLLHQCNHVRWLFSPFHSIMPQRLLLRTFCISIQKTMEQTMGKIKWSACIRTALKFHSEFSIVRAHTHTVHAFQVLRTNEWTNKQEMIKMTLHFYILDVIKKNGKIIKISRCMRMWSGFVRNKKCAAKNWNQASAHLCVCNMR